MSPFNQLPNEMLLHVFSFFNRKTIKNAELLNKRWHAISMNNSRLWKKLCNEEGIDLPVNTVNYRQLFHDTENELYNPLPNPG